MYKILIVTNDDAMRLLYEDELTGEGYEVAVSYCYTDLYEDIKKVGPDLVLILLSYGLTDPEKINFFSSITGNCLDLPVLVSAPLSRGIEKMENIDQDIFVIKTGDYEEVKSAVNIFIGESCKESGLDLPDRPSPFKPPPLAEQMELVFH